MRLQRLRSGEMLAGLGGAALLVLMFFDWFGVAEGSYEGEGGLTGYAGGAGASAWQSFAITDVLLCLTALAGMAVFALAVTHRSYAVPLAAAVCSSTLAVIASIVVLYRLINEPGPNELVTIEPAAYLGALATLAVVAGAWRSMADEGTDRPEALRQTEHVLQPPRKVPQG